jgi:hypothetical protein
MPRPGSSSKEATIGDPFPKAIYAVSLRLRRATVSSSYVSVPIVGDMVKLDEQDVGRIDPGKMTRRALEMDQQPDPNGYREDQSIELQPLQQAPEPDEIRRPSRRVSASLLNRNQGSRTDT